MVGPPVCSEHDRAFGGIFGIDLKVTGHARNPRLSAPSHLVRLTSYFLIIWRSVWLHSKLQIICGMAASSNFLLLN